MSLLLISFLAWILSVLAPCVLPVLPVILGSSMWTQKRYRPLIIVLSTAFFITFFTIILKVSTAFIDIPQSFWTSFSAIIIILYWLTLIQPQLWDMISEKLWLHNANALATKAKTYSWVRWDILLGASLGPIFASCSPTYALLLSVVFPKSFAAGVTYTIIYSLGFALLLLVFAYGWRAIIKKFSRAANPRGRFKKILWILLIITWLLIVSWYMKKLEVAILDAGIFDVGKIEQRLLQDMPTSQPKAEPAFGGEAKIMNAEWSQYLNVNYPAPEFAWLQNWINGWPYSSINELKWKVVIVDFWTYSCINCIRTLETLKKRDDTYRSKWLVIIGVHAPEFQFEKDINNVKKAVEDYGLRYTVVQDNDFQTRSNYENRFWPAKYIIDKQWNVRFTHFGEWGYEETEKVIQYLLGVHEKPVSTDETTSYMAQQSPETYLGAARGNTASYSSTTEINKRRLEWTRNQRTENLILTSDSGKLSMNVFASEINLVMWNSTNSSTAKVYIDGVLHETLSVKDKKLYQLWKWDTYGQHLLEIRFEWKWAEAYAFTFG
jgi:cytochrome c biogenesis protein CcdA/thiol-disulfide isomerase/thioredoxin